MTSLEIAVGAEARLLGKSSGYRGEVAMPSLLLCLYRKSLKGMYLFARCIRERKVLKHSLRLGFSDSFLFLLFISICVCSVRMFVHVWVHVHLHIDALG